MITDKELCELLISALDNKYSNVDIIALEKKILWHWRHIKNSTEPFLYNIKSTDLESDIHNQVKTMYLIENDWSQCVSFPSPLFTIHKTVYGYTNPHEFIRSTDTVVDYKKDIQVEIVGILPRLNELERISCQLLPCLKNGNTIIQSHFLAHMISSIIRIHPFQDGNGRLARMYTYYALKTWGKPYFIIPKVRNDQSWKNALGLAIDGKINDLAELIKLRIN